MNCPLCNTICTLDDNDFYQSKYLLCPECKGIFMIPKFYPTPEDEKSRYEEHNNDVSDPRYQKFVSPITDYILTNFSIDNKGLDFGAGTGPVISKMLADHNYNNIALYDPFFHNYPSLLNDKYDYIFSCEVIEHFHNPAKEFEKLKNMLTPGGHLICMTNIYNNKINFDKWFYKSDITHVFFYQKETFSWIKSKFKFNSLNIDNRLITLKN